MTRFRRRLVALGAAALGALGLLLGGTLASATGGAGEAASKTHTVLLTGFVFKPKTLSARAGDKVKFVWRDGVHNIVTVVGPSKITAKKPTDHRPPLIVTLKKGNYRLICEPHELVGMVITMRVR